MAGNGTSWPEMGVRNLIAGTSPRDESHGFDSEICDWKQPDAGSRRDFPSRIRPSSGNLRISSSLIQLASNLFEASS